MITPEILAQIRQIEIHTRHLLSGTQLGDYSTARKGSGFEFDQIRDYQEGDDIRFIDWKSSARMNKLLVRQYFEERNRTIILIVDCTASTKTGSTDVLKSELIAQVASVLALVAAYAKDCVGMILCSEAGISCLPARRGRAHVYNLMQQVMQAAQPQRTNVQKTMQLVEAIDYLGRLKVKRPVMITISDFIDDTLHDFIRRINHRGETLAIRCLDTLERTFPDVDALLLNDVENPAVIDGIRRRASVSSLLQERIRDQDRFFASYKIDLLDVTPGRPFMYDLVGFFRRRLLY